MCQFKGGLSSVICLNVVSLVLRIISVIDDSDSFSINRVLLWINLYRADSGFAEAC